MLPSSESVQVNGFGAFLVLIYPGAFVTLDEAALETLSRWRQLRIYCAGIWNNLMLAAVAVLLLWALPWILWPFYAQLDNSAHVYYVHPVRASSILFFLARHLG